LVTWAVRIDRVHPIFKTARPKNTIIYRPRRARLQGSSPLFFSGVAGIDEGCLPLYCGILPRCEFPFFPTGHGHIGSIFPFRHVTPPSRSRRADFPSLIYSPSPFSPPDLRGCKRSKRRLQPRCRVRFEGSITSELHIVVFSRVFRRSRVTLSVFSSVPPRLELSYLNRTRVPRISF